MEGVGARLGRSSTRYGPATVFNGPVRKWKKKWVHVSPSAAAAAAAAAAVAAASANNHNGTGNGNNGSRLLLYKWTPMSQSSSNGNSNGDSKIPGEDDGGSADVLEEPPRRRFKYVPIAVLEEPKVEPVEKTDEEAKPAEVIPTEGEPTSTSNKYDVKPDINDVPMEDNQAEEGAKVERQDLNESTLDLSLGLTAHDDESDSKADQVKDAGVEKSSGVDT